VGGCDECTVPSAGDKNFRGDAKVKRIGIALLIVSIVVANLTGCSQPVAPAPAEEAPSTSEEPSALSGEPVKIGYIGALSGNSADMGEPGRKGIVMAIEEANAEGGIGGRPIELVALDDEANPAKSVTQANKLVQQDKVVVSIGGPNSGTVLANREVFFKANIPVVVAIGTVDALVDPEHPTFKTTFRVSAYDSYMINLMASYVKDKGFQKIGVIADTTAYGQASVNTVQRIFSEKGIPVSEVVTHEVAATDLTSQALKLKNANVDIVYIYSLGPDAALFMKTIRQMGWEIPTLGGRGLNMAAFTDLAGDAADGIVIPCDADPNKPEMIEFTEKYRAKYGDTPNYMFPVLGYDTARVVIEGLRRSGGEGGDALIQALESISDFPMTLGQPDARLSFGPDKHEGATRGWDVLLTVKNGQFVLYDEFPPEE
jgi:branched-chain amino acid transport system substrate-binding protein